MKAFIFFLFFLSFSNLFAQEDELKETLQRKVEFEQMAEERRRIGEMDARIREN